MKNIEEIKNYFIKEIIQKELTSKKHKKTCVTLNYIEHSLTLASAFTGYIPIPAFACLLAIPIGIVSK